MALDKSSAMYKRLFLYVNAWQLRGIPLTRIADSIERNRHCEPELAQEFLTEFIQELRDRALQNL
jgi:hypothetical protein